MSRKAKRGPCAICNLVTTNWCSRCEDRFYCSPLHLYQEWPRHRLSCRSVYAPAPAPRVQGGPLLAQSPGQQSQFQPSEGTSYAAMQTTTATLPPQTETSLEYNNGENTHPLQQSYSTYASPETALPALRLPPYAYPGTSLPALQLPPYADPGTLLPSWNSIRASQEVTHSTAQATLPLPPAPAAPDVRSTALETFLFTMSEESVPAQVRQPAAQPSTTAPLQASSSPPSSPDTPTSSFEAIYFPKYSFNAYIVSVPCRSPGTRGESMCPQPVVDSFLSTSGSRQPAAVVLTKNLGCERRYPLQVWYCPDSGTFNRAIWKVTSGQARHVVKGDVLVMKFAGKRRQGYMDATNLDLAALTQYFLSQG